MPTKDFQYQLLSQNFSMAEIFEQIYWRKILSNFIGISLSNLFYRVQFYIITAIFSTKITRTEILRIIIISYNIIIKNSFCPNIYRGTIGDEIISIWESLSNNTWWRKQASLSILFGSRAGLGSGMLSRGSHPQSKNIVIRESYKDLHVCFI